MTRPSKPTAPKQANDPGALSFEQALEQVESIIDRIERGEIGLEQSLAEYERGVQLIHHCRQIHKHATQRVDDLTKRLMAGGEGGGGGGEAGASAPLPDSADLPSSDDDDDPES